jgi:hypothetical protein
MHYRRKGQALALGLGVVATGLAGLGLAGAATQQPTAQQAAMDRFCSDEGPCVVINGAADPDAVDDESHLSTAAQALAATGKPPSACPQADAAYSEVGIDADAFIGGCPEELPADSASAEEENTAGLAEAMAVEGGAQ